MTPASVSVVVVSRGRPDALAHCLSGIAQLDYPNFEVVVVADAAGIIAAQAREHADHLKLIRFDQANISAARNLGIAASAGDIVAFIDDDAVPEPTWLSYLCAPFGQPEVGATGGFVRGRNGISFQWKAQAVDHTGQTISLQIDETRATILHPTPERAIKTEGTNMAVRRDILAELGGFDPAFRFYLDETDLNMRLAQAGWATALVPLAEVHHGYLGSDQRSAERAPKDLVQLGASVAVFLKKYCPSEQHPHVWRRVVREQRNRALRHMMHGRLEPRDVRKLMQGLSKGYKEGGARSNTRMTSLPRAAQGFHSFPKCFEGGALLLSGRYAKRNTLRRKAALHVKGGTRVTIFIYSYTALFHKVRFHPGGYWEHTGGVFGRSDRVQKLFTLATFKRRVISETSRISAQRGL